MLRRSFLGAMSGVTRRPNLLFLLTDDQRADLLGCAGHPILQTPNVDRLATEGALFERAFDVDKVSRIDFGTGDDGYKRDWMEETAPLMTVRAWDPRQPKAWPSLAKHLAKRVAARVSPR